MLIHAFKMVYRNSPISNAYLYPARYMKLIRMNLRLQPILLACPADGFCLLWRKEPLFAENINVVGKFFSCNLGQHLFNNQSNIPVSVILIGCRKAMCTQKG